MFLKYNIIHIYVFIQLTLALRRIQNGQEVKSDKRYAVYFIKAKTSSAKYKGWTCGGAIVSPSFIITSAACIEDVNHLYAIAGYKKFVEYESIDDDKCTKVKKKKVVFTCVPKPYILDYNNVEKWAYADIAVVRVESPFDFTDKSYETDCSYIPGTIPINYEAKYQMPGTDAMALGWGHLEMWRMVNDTTSYNSEYLNFASTLILDKTECKKQYKDEVKDSTTLFKIIDKYMICTLGPGNIDDAGELTIKNTERADGCLTAQEKRMGMTGVSCEENSKTTEEEIQESNKEGEQNDGEATLEVESRDEVVKTKMRKQTVLSKSLRRNGICQNDHGGPLVTWVGAHEVLIGVASVFRVTKEYKCIGPYLFTSTQCNGKFLDCVINEDDDKTDANKPVERSDSINTTDGVDDTIAINNFRKSDRRRRCNRPPSELGYHMVKRRISWIGHPDGPADNELFDRPQVPLSNYHFKEKE